MAHPRKTARTLILCERFGFPVAARVQGYSAWGRYLITHTGPFILACASSRDHIPPS